MSIYTKKGDKGKTSIFKGKSTRVSKNSPEIRAIGAIDELNSFLGMVIAFSDRHLDLVNKELYKVQRNLLTIGSIIAGSKLKFGKSETKSLEKLIDKFDKNLPPLHKFILPGGTKLASLLQYTRALARRTEREVVDFNENQKVLPEILTYLNRLSDTLYVLARWVNINEGGKELIWNSSKNKLGN